MTAHYMVIDNSHCLHIGIYNCAAYKFKAKLFQVFANLIRERGLSGQIALALKMIKDWRIVNIRPYKGIKAAIFFLDFYELLCIRYC